MKKFVFLIICAAIVQTTHTNYFLGYIYDLHMAHVCEGLDQYEAASCSIGVIVARDTVIKCMDTKINSWSNSVINECVHEMAQ